MKKRSCPKCGSKNVVPIVYGLPTEETWKEAEKGHLVLGSCVVVESNPMWRCKDCQHDIKDKTEDWR